MPRLPRLAAPHLALPPLPRLARPDLPQPPTLPRLRLGRPRLPDLPPLPRVPHLPHLPPLPNLGPLPIALLLVGAVAWYHFGFVGFSLAGSIVDDTTGQPIDGARVWATRASTTSSTTGSFVLDGVKPPELVSIDAGGYRATSLRVTSPFEPLVARLQPIAVQINAVDADTGLPVPAALSPPGGASTLGAGTFRVAPVRPGQRFELSADGYAPAVATYDGQDLRVSLRPNLTGHVTDAQTGKPVADARVKVGDVLLSTDADGAYTLQHRPTAGSLQVLVPGYRRAQVDLGSHLALDVQLQPAAVRAIYMTYFAIGGDEYRQQMYQLLDTTEVNAVVIDVKGDYGLLSYRSQVPLAQQIGADAQPTIDDVDDLLASIHQHGGYAIARIVVFKDDMLAHHGDKAGLDVGVKDRRTGQVWTDGEGLGWVDPFQPAAWDYNTALAKEAIEHGFDEVQFDYIRFPTDPSPNSTIGDIVYSQPMNDTTRVAALHSFLGRAHKAVNDAGGFLGMDTFGYTTWWDDDGGIGQDLSVLADDIDYYCPMVYPSTFSAGLPGQIPYPEVVSRPYEVIYRSLLHVQDKLAGKRVVIRPWLQYFDDYPWATKTRYDAAQIEAQKKAVADADSRGWMLWNPGSLFKRGGLAPKH